MRWKNHLTSLRYNKHKNPKLQAHFNKYGEDDLVFFIITICHKDHLIELEQFYLDAFLPWFNVHKIADRPNTGKRSPETCRKISEAGMGRTPWNKGLKTGPQSEEMRKKRSEANKGQVPWIKGKHHSEESKKKSSESHKGKNTWTLGRKSSDETRKKISEALKGQNWWKIGRKQSQETIDKRMETIRRNKLLKVE